MSILFKNIGGKKYAYQAYRVGNKVVHKYIGPAVSEATAEKIAVIKSTKKVPQKLHRFFWDVDPLKLDTKSNTKYIVERILEMGDLNAIQWLEWIYPAKVIMEVIETTRKVSQKSKNFWRIWYEKQPLY